MILSIKFTSQNIYISEQSRTKGFVKVYRTVQTDMPEGAYQKGVIINTAAVADKIKELLREQNIRTKRTVAIVHGVDITHKEFALPIANDVQTRGMLENELRKNDLLKSEYLFDFVSDGKTKKGTEEATQNVDTYLMPKPLVQNYVHTLQRAGLIPIRIKPFHDTMDKLVRLMQLDQKKDISIVVYAESNMAEICMTGKDIKNVYRSIQREDEEMFEENIFILSSKQNLLGGKDSEEVMLETITDNISKLVQFQMQSNRELRVAQVILYGELAQRSRFVEKVQELTGIEASKCEISDQILRLANNQCNLLANFDLLAVDVSPLVGEEKELGFVKQYHEQRSGYITKKDQLPVYILSIILLVMILAGGVIWLIDYQNRREIHELDVQIEEMITSTQYNENLIKRKLADEYIVYNRICKQYIETLESTERLESELLVSLEALKPETVSILSYTFENKIFLLECRGEQQDNPAYYAELVTNSEIFKTVEYAGFRLEMDIEGNSYYQFQLKCTLKN